MKLGRLCFLFLFIFSVFGISRAATTAEDEKTIPTSLFKATIKDGRQVYVLGTNHVRPVHLEPKSLVLTLEEIARQHPTIIYVTESGEEDCAENCFFSASFLKHACYQNNADVVAALEKNYGNKDTFEAEKRRLEVLVAQFFPVYAAAGIVDGHHLQELHPIPFLWTVMTYHMAKKRKAKKRKEESMEDILGRLFNKGPSGVRILETDEELYGSMFHPSILASSRLFSEFIGMAEEMLARLSDTEEDDGSDEEDQEFEDQKRQPRSTEHIGEEGSVCEWLYQARQLRNQAWERRLCSHLDSTPKGVPFIVGVGMSHLADDTGVFKMLERYAINDTGIEQLMHDGSWRTI